MAAQGDGQDWGPDQGRPDAPLTAVPAADPPAPTELPAHVKRTLESSVGARPERRAVELQPRPDDRVLRRLSEAGVTQRDLRLRNADDSPRAARATERLINALALHTQHDLRLSAGRCEAMAQSLGYLFWFQRRFGERGPIDLTPETVRSCFGNYYIRRGGGDRPVLSWIHYGLRGAATCAAFLCRAGWWSAERAESVLALADDGPWFRHRLETYWIADGDEWHEWLAEADPLGL